MALVGKDIFAIASIIRNITPMPKHVLGATCKHPTYIYDSNVNTPNYDQGPGSLTVQGNDASHDDEA
eukprot:scaffold210682_cov17-Prasinocladus_malaysianus.AAC.1